MNSSQKLYVCALAALAFAFLSPALRAAQEPRSQAQTTAPALPQAGDTEHKDAEKESAIPPEKLSVTHHDITLNGKTLKYTATAGTLTHPRHGRQALRQHVLRGLHARRRRPATRPVAFLYNGGPGSATLWLHMGSFSPVRVQTDSPNPTAARPSSWFPTSTRCSTKPTWSSSMRRSPATPAPSAKAPPKDLTGTDPDLRAFDRFILRYLTVNQRWNSPKFLIGESYGTTRSAALADMLGNDGVQLNGVVLISSILNYNIRAGGYDIIYIANLPSYAAAAWYFDKIPNKPANLADWVQQARDFAAGPYAHALFAGDNLPAAQARRRRQAGQPLYRPQRGLHQGSQPAHLAHPLPQGGAARRPQYPGPLRHAL